MKIPVIFIYSFFCVFLFCHAVTSQAGDLTSISEVYWQRVSGNVLPDNAFPLLTDNDIHYYSCRPVYFGRDPALIRLFKTVRGTVGFEPDGMMTCDYIIYAYGSLTGKRSLISYLPDDHDDILDQFRQIHPDQFLYSSRTSPGTPFDLLSTSDGSQQEAQISYTSEHFEESAMLPSRKLFLSDTSDNSPSFKLNGSLAQCQDNNVKIEFSDDIFCIPKAEYCRKSRPPYLMDGIFFSESDSSTPALHWHDVIGISFVSNPADAVSERCYWHQEPQGVFEELTGGLPGFQKVLFTLPSLSRPESTTILNTTETTAISALNRGPQSQDLSQHETFAQAVTAIGTTVTLSIPVAIAVTIIVMRYWSNRVMETLKQPNDV